MAIDIELNSGQTGVLECSLSYTREGYVPIVYVTGDNTKIETTLFEDVTDFPSSFLLKSAWVGSATADQKENDPTKTDVYSRFSTDPEDVFYSDIDYYAPGAGARGLAGPKMYRDFTTSTFNYDTANEAISANVLIENSEDVWKRTGSIGLGSRKQDGAVPYLRIQGGDPTVEFTNKDKNKAVSCIVEGRSHMVSKSSIDADVENAWFYPMTVSSADRFKRYKVYQSYRGTPIAAATTLLDERDDAAALQSYADQLVQNTTIPAISGSITFSGRKQYSIGDIVGQITKDGRATPVNLAIVDQSTQYSPPRQAGESGQDTVTIELGRK